MELTVAGNTFTDVRLLLSFPVVVFILRVRKYKYKSISAYGTAPIQRISIKRSINSSSCIFNRKTLAPRTNRFERCLQLPPSNF